MAGPIQPPIKGQPMRASWGAAVSSAVNSLLPMGSDGLLSRQGVAGTGFAALPANKRDRRVAKAAKTPGRFDYEIYFDGEEGEEAGSRKIRFNNCYFDLAGKTLSTGGIANEFALPDGEVLFVLRVDATSRQGTSRISSYTGGGTIGQMRSAQNDRDVYITPLYLFTDGSLTCDFRTGPYVAMGEASL